jgi:hypothetical protein
MASRLSSLLEQESEHQWLAIGLFALFALAGGWAINASSDLSGVGRASMDAAWTQEDLLDVALVEGTWSNAHVGLVDTDAGQRIYLQTGANADDFELLDASERPSRLFAQNDGSVWWDAVAGEVRGVSSDGLRITATTGLEDERVLDLLVIDEQGVYGLLLFRSGTSTGVVAFDGLEGNFTSLSAPEGVTWTDLEVTESGQVLAAGWRMLEGSNPATPDVVSVVSFLSNDAGTLSLDGGSVDGPEGYLHTLLPRNAEEVVLATRQGAMLLDSSGSRTFLNVPSLAAAVDAEGQVWLIGAADSTTVVVWDGTGTDVRSMPTPLGIQVEVSTSTTSTWLLFGPDENGTLQGVDIDMGIEASVLSGRGFLNMLFLLVGVISLVGVGASWWAEARRSLD